MSYVKKPKAINPDEVDPSVYYYDEVYDEMKVEEESKSIEKQTLSRERRADSKYIQGLKETAEQRKIDKEIRKFKRYTRDRDEVETDKNLSGEDVYITSAYRKKLREIEKLECEKKRQVEHEKDNSMNFTKKKSDQTKLDSKSKDKERSPREVAPVPSSSKEYHEVEEKLDDINSLAEPINLESPQHRPIRKPLKTLEDRRAYLREILAKKTIGKIYDEAVRRYIERKAQLQK